MSSRSVIDKMVTNAMWSGGFASSAALAIVNGMDWWLVVLFVALCVYNGVRLSMRDVRLSRNVKVLAEALSHVPKDANVTVEVRVND